MAHPMCRLEDLGPQCRGGRDEDVALAEDEAIYDRPARTGLATFNLQVLVDDVL